MTVKLGDILCYNHQDYYLVCKHPQSKGKLAAVCIGLARDNPGDYILKADDGSWDMELAINTGHTRIIGNIFDKE